MSAIVWVVIVAAAVVALVVLGLVWFTARIAGKVEAVLPPLGRFVEVDGARLHYVDEGSGPPIVMIHGLAGQMRHFTHSLAGDLKRDFHVIVIDRPGCGHSTRAPGSSARLSAQAATIAKLIQTLGLSRPLVVGHSLGGAVSLALALNHPESVGGLALVAPLTHPREHVAAVFKGLLIPSPFVRRLVAWTLATPLSILRAKAALAMVFGPEPVVKDYRIGAGGLLGLRPRAFIAASTDLMAANEDLPGMVARYGTLKLPVGIIYGRGDRLLDYRENGEAMVPKMPGLQLTLVEGGHMLPMTQPAETARFIRAQAARKA